MAVLFSSVVRVDDLPDDSILQASPGIFQALTPKAFELRVTAMGERLFAAKLNSQEVRSAAIDWRAASEPIPIEPFLLPETVGAACLKVMQELGIVFGCFDLIVTPEGDYVFLEVNEMGAFLWLEERCPDLLLLDAFCEFLLQGSTNFVWPGHGSALHLSDISSEALRKLEIEAPKLHVPRPPSSLTDEG